MAENLKLTHDIELTKSEFDAFVKAGRFVVGPFSETFGDMDEEPYRPRRRAYGTLDDGRKVWAQVQGGGDE